MTTTVTLNPMLDKTIDVASVRRGAIERARAISWIAGGKGVNVSRQLKVLGSRTVATGFLGGEIGTLIGRLLTEEGIDHDFVRVAGMTREGLTFREADGVVTAVFEPPHEVTGEDVHRLAAHCTSLLARSSWLVCSGSSPSPVADGLYREIIREARRLGVQTILDCYGEALRIGIEADPTILKMNRDEYRKTFARDLAGALPDIDAWLADGIRYIVITDGPRPVLAADREHRWVATPTVVTTVNPAGSGDSMTAGLIYGIEQGWTFENALRFACAAGAANARTWEVSNRPVEDIMSLEPQVHISIT